MTVKFLKKKQAEGYDYFVNRKAKKMISTKKSDFLDGFLYEKYELDYSRYGIIFYKRVGAVPKNIPKGRYRAITEKYFKKKLRNHTIIQLSCRKGKNHKIIKHKQDG